MTDGPTDSRPLHPSVLEAASWRLGSELVRRHPHQLVLLHTHPGGGQYDCLTLALSQHDSPLQVFQLNRRGTIQVHYTAQGDKLHDAPRFAWHDYLSSQPYRFLRHLEDIARLAPPRSVPASTPASLTLRLLAAITATAVMSVHPVEVHSGFLDSSGGSGPRDDLFTAIPATELARQQRSPRDLLGIPEYRFWFVTIDRLPVLALETTGRCWNSVGDEFDIVDLYEANIRRLWPVVTTVVGHHLR